MASVFDSPPPSLTDDQLQQLASAVFGIRGSLAPLVSERDQNVRIDTDDGSYVLKVAHAAESPDVLHLQEAVLEHLRTVDPDLPVPRIVPPGIATDDRHLVRVVTHLPGTPAALLPSTTEYRRSLGAVLGRLSRALQGFGHAGAHRPDFLWNLDHPDGVAAWIPSVTDPGERALVERAFRRHQQRVRPRIPRLRAAVVHHDANDHNVLVLDGRVSGLIDFGDMVHARQVNELAVALAYALLDADDLVAWSADVIAAYTAEFPLTDDELFVLFDLVAMRLAMSITVSSHRAAAHPGNDYLLVSREPAVRLLQRLMAMRPQFLHFAARQAAGLAAVPNHDAVVAWLGSPACRAASPLPFSLRRAARLVVSLADGAPLTAFGDDPVAGWQWIRDEMARHDATVAIGRYDEDRACYDGEQFVTDAPEARSVHLGIDLFVEAGTPLHSVLDGVVETVVDNALAYDYGPTVIVRHEAGDAGPFWILYGHLARSTLTTVRPGQPVSAGEVIGAIGDHTVNGGWPPHVHVQVITDLMADPDTGPDGNFEGAGEPSRMGIWRRIAPDASMVLGLGPETFAAPSSEPGELLARRLRALGPSLSVSYRRPLTVLRGRGTWLIDHTGREHLDCVNNVAHVGHSHPRVVEAIARQAARLNTNTRYLHPAIVDYAERLAALFPDPLSVVYLTNSGSEANELALRIARTATGRHDVIAVDWGYHGNTNDLVEISAYKFNRRGGSGKPAHTHLAELPDPYRGRFGADGPAYAAAIADLPPSAAFIAESVSGCGGQVVFPPGYLAAAYGHARAAGAVCIADEVQVGFGRVGEAMWAFELQGVVPDIVTLGKPIGNGHPLGAVVTTRALADEFANGMEWFNTFGGNPVSCAAGMAVLDVIEQDGLRARARDTGDQLLAGLRALAEEHDCIGDVRGHGLYLGVDLVIDRRTKEPATSLAADVANGLRERGVLVSTDGPADNVLKIKPPIVFGADEADILLDELAEVLPAIV